MRSTVQSCASISKKAQKPAVIAAHRFIQTSFSSSYLLGIRLPPNGRSHAHAPTTPVPAPTCTQQPSKPNKVYYENEQETINIAPTFVVTFTVQEKFRFRHFTVRQCDGMGMKVGTDAMLLGAWADCANTSRALDVGTGTGVLALMIAQRAPTAIIDAIDIDHHAYTTACSNLSSSPWSTRITAHHTSLQDFAAEHNVEDQCRQHGPYDLIISNPPFFQNASKPTSSRRSAARHADDRLPFTDLAAYSSTLLSPTGRLVIILPTTEATIFTNIALSHGLYLSRMLRVRTKATDETERRRIMEFHTLRNQQHIDIGNAASTGHVDEHQGGGEARCDDVQANYHEAAAEDVVSIENTRQTYAGSEDANTHPACVEEELVINEFKFVPDLGTTRQVLTQQYRALTADFHHPDYFDL